MRPACRRAVDLFCAKERPACQLERVVRPLTETALEKLAHHGEDR
jgi:hypothetical protein